MNQGAVDPSLGSRACVEQSLRHDWSPVKDPGDAGPGSPVSSTSRLNATTSPAPPYGSEPGEGQNAEGRVPREEGPPFEMAGGAGGYLTVTPAPAASRVALAFSAVSLLTFSKIGLGAPSTRSLASFRPRLVRVRTSLMT